MRCSHLTVLEDAKGLKIKGDQGRDRPFFVLVSEFYSGFY